jgi:hypothetical protein
MKELLADLLVWLLASPFLFIRWLVGQARHVTFLRTAYQPSIICRNCGATVSLVGIWRCGCGFTYKGHLLRECPVCSSLPAMVRCYRCQVTERLPEP